MVKQKKAKTQIQITQTTGIFYIIWLIRIVVCAKTCIKLSWANRVLTFKRGIQYNGEKYAAEATIGQSHSTWKVREGKVVEMLTNIAHV